MSELQIGIGVPFFKGLGLVRLALDRLVAHSDEHWTAVVVEDRSLEAGAADGLRDAATGCARMTTSDTAAFILAGGRGSRLAPLPR